MAGPIDQVRQAQDALNVGVLEHSPSKVFSLLSGGDDSLTVTKVASAHPLFRGVIHLDTGTGVRETREFVEDTCRREGWPLKVYSAPSGEYERLVLEGHMTRAGVVLRGFPNGLKSHATMYWFLKQRQLHRALREHKDSRHDRIGFVSGLRVSESNRRKMAKMAKMAYKDPERSIVWLQPILNWTKADCLDYLESTGTPRNPVSINCHRSGECLCGALANNAELGEIAFFYPEVGERFAALEAKALELGIVNAEWAGGPTTTRRLTARSGLTNLSPLCTACQLSMFDEAA